jgi:hypothetical protein
MSGENDNFIARWSRLKRAAASRKRVGEPADDGSTTGKGGPDAAPRPQAAAQAGPGGPEPAFDPEFLPSIESIVADTDVRAFLQKGVPAVLTKAALRRAWSADPAIRDFMEVAENQWDFTDPTAIPGFGSLRATDNVRELVRQAMGKLSEPPPDDAVRPADEQPDAVAPAAADDAPEMRTQGAPSSEEPDRRDTADAAALQHRESAQLQHQEPAQEVGTAPCRKGHGGALPR